MEGIKITSGLFRKDLRDKDFRNEFKRIFQIKIEDVLSEYEYNEIDEFPIEIENRGIMIGFGAETVKVPAQVEYIDLDVYNHSQNIGYLVKTIPIDADFEKPEDIEEYLAPFRELRIYYSLYNLKQVDRVIFHYEDLRYELSVNSDCRITRVRICLAENETNINMRTYYLFDNG
ncbi:MAG: hypothetical protein BGO31_20695 [Bacteroidetes bacterium 43-16]|uniref:hypothetical protein n=1 Tax=uncultured Dysgonomonas sp. TaxID=206096 RepID=UPI00092C1293|nr:hypothetical protein [uncultured Dysgonomonas sp.]OJV55351.1 MAG: hypothetical protein BGO31_20695 [Bacteroidetes bacterium 43-16]